MGFENDKVKVFVVASVVFLIYLISGSVMAMFSSSEDVEQVTEVASNNNVVRSSGGASSAPQSGPFAGFNTPNPSSTPSRRANSNTRSDNPEVSQKKLTTFEEVMKSRGSSNANRQVQKNLYFDKLREQMQELRGDNAPEFESDYDDDYGDSDDFYDGESEAPPEEDEGPYEDDYQDEEFGGDESLDEENWEEEEDF